MAMNAGPEDGKFGERNLSNREDQDYNCAELCRPCEMLFSGHWIKDKHVPAGCSIGKNPSSGSHFDTFDRDRRVRVGTAEATIFQPVQHHAPNDLWNSTSDCYLCLALLRLLKGAVMNRYSKPLIAFAWLAELEHQGPDKLFLRYAFYTKDEFDSPRDRYGALDMTFLPLKMENTLKYPPLRLDANHEQFSKSLRRIRDWIHSCDNDHDNCRSRALGEDLLFPKEMPSRLLEIHQDVGQLGIRLVKNGPYEDEVQYAALSHCWGGSQPMRLLHGNMDVFTKGIPIESLPLTFQQAVKLCSSLGIRYLWIDSLCIIQDSVEDWQRECSRMQLVYFNCWINIAATASASSLEGLFRLSPMRQTPVFRASWTGDLRSGDYLIDYRQLWTNAVDREPLNQRAWVLQERMLSPRTIHFGSDQVWWSCLTNPACCEQAPTGFPTGLAPENMTPHLQPAHVMHGWPRIWDVIVKKYSRSNLTRTSDKLIALSGLAKHIAETMEMPASDYLAGIWRDSLPQGLLWTLVNPMTETRERAPSWSWASFDGPADTETAFEASKDVIRLHYRSEVIHAQTTPCLDPFAAVVDGSIKIRGPLVGISRWTSSDDRLSAGVITLLYTDMMGQTLVECNADLFPDSESALEALRNDDTRFFFAAIKVVEYIASGSFTIHGLVLEQLLASRDQFYRAGFLEIDCEASHVDLITENVEEYFLR